MMALDLLCQDMGVTIPGLLTRLPAEDAQLTPPPKAISPAPLQASSTIPTTRTDMQSVTPRGDPGPPVSTSDMPLATELRRDPSTSSSAVSAAQALSSPTSVEMGSTVALESSGRGRVQQAKASPGGSLLRELQVALQDAGQQQEDLKLENRALGEQVCLQQVQ